MTWQAIHTRPYKPAVGVGVGVGEGVEGVVREGAASRFCVAAAKLSLRMISTTLPPEIPHCTRIIRWASCSAGGSMEASEWRG